MVIVKEGNLLEATENIIGHQVNCMGVMGAGVAYQIRRKWPVVFEEYERMCRGKGQKYLLGKVQIVPVVPGCNPEYVVNMFSQGDHGHDGRYTNYGAMSKALYALKKIAQDTNLSVALPFNIGCALGGGDWNIVSQLVEDIFDDYDVTLYKLPQGANVSL